MKWPCGPNSFCTPFGHRAHCTCVEGYTGDPTSPGGCVPIVTIPPPPEHFPRPDITVNCLADGVNTQLYIEDKNFHGIMYVKGHSHNPACRRTVDPADTADLVDFTVKFDTCGLFHYNVSKF